MRLVLSIIFCLFLTPKLYSQNVVVDWVSKDLQSSPPKVNRRTTATIQVLHVNDVLYRYSIQLIATPRANDDFSFLKGAISTKASEAASDPDCTKLLQVASAAEDALKSSLSTFYKLPETPTTKKTTCSAQSPCTFNMEDTSKAWDSTVFPKIKPAGDAAGAILSEQFCLNNFEKEARELKGAVDEVSGVGSYIKQSEHTISTERTLDPDVDYTLNVKELYVNRDTQVSKPTNADVLSVKFSPANDRLTLSAGVLLSTIQNRSYTSQAQPNSSNTGTDNVLSVSGRSPFNPLALGLLNYEIPPIAKATFSNDNYGLAVSTGPTIRFGSKSETSSFGYFLGLGLHLYHRLYLTPGIHIGEFADYPLGFSQPGQVIPSGIGTPTPVKRYTLRFAFGITYKAKDFSGLGLSTTVTPKAPDVAPKDASGSKP